MCFSPKFWTEWKYVNIFVLKMQSKKEIIYEMLYSRHFLSAWEAQVILFWLAVGSQKEQV